MGEIKKVVYDTLRENENLKRQLDSCIRELNKQYKVIDSLVKPAKVNEEGIKYKCNKDSDYIDSISEFELDDNNLKECNLKCEEYDLDECPCETSHCGLDCKEFMPKGWDINKWKRFVKSAGIKLNCNNCEELDIIKIDLNDIPKDMSVEEYIKHYLIPQKVEPTKEEKLYIGIINEIADLIKTVSIGVKLERNECINLAIEIYKKAINNYEIERNS